TKAVTVWLAIDDADLENGGMEVFEGSHTHGLIDFETSAQDAGNVLDQTVRAVEAELRDGDFVHRYYGGDGLEGAEGAFLICSFWLVDALLATGRADEAEALFDRLCALGNDVGLFAEEADPETGAHLGNFPQAFTHLALIGSAVNLSLYKEGGIAAIKGSYTDRAARSTVATEGLRGLLATIRQTKRPVRLRASKASVLRAS
ncbi:MAG: glycoside hydrolase family 15 protein, partial [Pseudomonadota bacterium]